MLKQRHWRENGVIAVENEKTWMQNQMIEATEFKTQIEWNFTSQLAWRSSGFKSKTKFASFCFDSC